MLGGTSMVDNRPWPRQFNSLLIMIRDAGNAGDDLIVARTGGAAISGGRRHTVLPWEAWVIADRP